MSERQGCGAFTLAEVMIAMVGSILILGALMLSSTQLQRTLYASERTAVKQSDQRRLIDYLGRDLRRAVGIATTTATNGRGGLSLTESSVLIENGVSMVLTLPGYYQSEASTDDNYDEALPVVAAQNRVDYGVPSGETAPVIVIFRKELQPSEGGQCFVRYEGDTRLVVVSDAENLHCSVALGSQGKVCKMDVWFTLGSKPSDPKVSCHDEILLRNTRID